MGSSRKLMFLLHYFITVFIIAATVTFSCANSRFFEVMHFVKFEDEKSFLETT